MKTQYNNRRQELDIQHKLELKLAENESLLKKSNGFLHRNRDWQSSF
jgi:hypothetical protein